MGCVVLIWLGVGWLGAWDGRKLTLGLTLEIDDGIKVDVGINVECAEGLNDAKVGTIVGVLLWVDAVVGLFVFLVVGIAVEIVDGIGDLVEGDTVIGLLVGVVNGILDGFLEGWVLGWIPWLGHDDKSIAVKVPSFPEAVLPIIKFVKYCT